MIDKIISALGGMFVKQLLYKTMLFFIYWALLSFLMGELVGRLIRYLGEEGIFNPSPILLNAMLVLDQLGIFIAINMHISFIVANWLVHRILDFLKNL